MCDTTVHTFKFPVKPKRKLGTGAGVLSPAICEAKTRRLLEPQKGGGQFEESAGLGLKITRATPKAPLTPGPLSVFWSLLSSTLAACTAFCIFLVFIQWDVESVRTFYECKRIPDSSNHRRKESLSRKDFRPSWWGARGSQEADWKNACTGCLTESAPFILCSSPACGNEPLPFSLSQRWASQSLSPPLTKALTIRTNPGVVCTHSRMSLHADRATHGCPCTQIEQRH